MKISRENREKVIKLLGLIGSHSDNEALVAARKAHQIVQDSGTTWYDVFADAQDKKPLHHAIEAPHLLVVGTGIISSWERGFLRNIIKFTVLSDKQKAVLDGIRHKVESNKAA